MLGIDTQQTKFEFFEKKRLASSLADHALEAQGNMTESNWHTPFLKHYLPSAIRRLLLGKPCKHDA
jgi:hypothetical protein